LVSIANCSMDFFCLNIYSKTWILIVVMNVVDSKVVCESCVFLVFFFFLFWVARVLLVFETLKIDLFNR